MLALACLLGLAGEVHATPTTMTGAEALLADPTGGALGGLKVGFITNRSAVDRKGVPIVESLARHPRIELAAILAPEHGFFADRQGHVGDAADPASGVPVYSLYGKTMRPTPEMLAGLDALAFDIQDVGSRFYTFISTMLYGLEAARDARLKFVVLDRPNPIGGEILEGGVLEPKFRSFTGPWEIPVRHGMTVGELARLFNARIGADLAVVPMSGWKRAIWFDQTGLPWTKPSPAMVGLRTATAYPGMCFFEASNVECRVGEYPFERIAAPWLHGDEVAADLQAAGLPGVRIQSSAVSLTEPNPYSFRSASWWLGFGIGPAGGATASLAGHRAVTFEVIDRSAFRPVRTAIAALAAIRRRHGDQLQLEARGFDRLAGTDRVRVRLLAGEPAEAIVRDWEASLPQFGKDRQPYLLYR